MVQGGEQVDDVLPVMNEEMNAVLQRANARAPHAGEVMR